MPGFIAGQVFRFSYKNLTLQKHFTLYIMKIELISNKRFCTLNIKDREHLKQSSINFITINGKETHYIKEKESHTAFKTLNTLVTEYLKRNSVYPLSIFINPDTCTEMLKTYLDLMPYDIENKTLEENITEELF